MLVARFYYELLAWQLADELKREVYALVVNSSACKDFDFRDQIRKSASAAPTNIAEGFAYYRHPEFGRHVRIAKSEITETQNHLRDGVDRRHWSRDQAEKLQTLAGRAIAATTRLLQYLDSSEAPSPWPKRRRSR